MNPTFAALNILVLAILLVVFVVPRLREHQESKAEVPRSIRPNRPGQELADAVTEWAKTTGVLAAEGVVDSDQVADSHADLSEEHA